MTNNEYAFSQVRSTIGLLNCPIAFSERRLLIRGSGVRVPPGALGYAGQRPIWYLNHVFKNAIGPISVPFAPSRHGRDSPSLSSRWAVARDPHHYPKDVKFAARQLHVAPRTIRP